jgi:PAS domain S-box-containing protein
MEYITKAMQMDAPLRFDWIHRRTDGTEFPCEISLIKIVLSGKQHLLTSIRDITERKRTEKAIHLMAQRYHTILSSHHSGILVVTEEDKIEFANQTFCDQFGLQETPSELIGMTAAEMLRKILPAYADPTEMELRIKEIVTQGQPVIGEGILMSNGRFFLRDFQPILIDGSKSGRMWQHMDITERKEAEESMRQQMNELERFNLLTINREIQMIQLKEEVNTLYEQAGKEKKYKIVEQNGII